MLSDFSISMPWYYHIYIPSKKALGENLKKTSHKKKIATNTHSEIVFASSSEGSFMYRVYSPRKQATAHLPWAPCLTEVIKGSRYEMKDFMGMPGGKKGQIGVEMTLLQKCLNFTVKLRIFYLVWRGLKFCLKGPRYLKFQRLKRSKS